MAFLPSPPSNAVVLTNFADLEVNFDTPKAEAEQLLAAGMTMDDIREYKRALNGHGKTPIQ